MPAARIHLVRHGEVANPTGVLYERLDGFPLSARGHAMADAAAAALQADGIAVDRLLCSPLERTRQSAQPWADRFGVEAEADERLIEPWNRFAGRAFGMGAGLLLRPWAWRHLLNPAKPSWGEPFTEVAARMFDVMNAAADAATGSGDIVMVSHQMPICMVQRSVAGLPLPHDPRKRRVALSSITTFDRAEDGSWSEVAYRDPAAQLATEAVDRGAV